MTNQVDLLSKYIKISLVNSKLVAPNELKKALERKIWTYKKNPALFL